MTASDIQALEAAALEFAATHRNPHNSMQEHAAKCAEASAFLIAAALTITENESAN